MGKRTWTATHALYLKKLFREGKADPQKQQASYMKRVYEEHNLFTESIPFVRNFYSNYRKVAADYIEERSRSGLRRADGKVLNCKKIVYVYFYLLFKTTK